MRVATSIFRPLWHHHNTAEEREREREMEEGRCVDGIRYGMGWAVRALVIVDSDSHCILSSS